MLGPAHHIISTTPYVELPAHHIIVTAHIFKYENIIDQAFFFDNFFNANKVIKSDGEL